jgi:hypothetical protein
LPQSSFADLTPSELINFQINFPVDELLGLKVAELQKRKIETFFSCFPPYKLER